jgi:hypothetical protein
MSERRLLGTTPTVQEKQLFEKMNVLFVLQQRAV